MKTMLIVLMGLAMTGCADPDRTAAAMLLVMHSMGANHTPPVATFYNPPPMVMPDPYAYSQPVGSMVGSRCMSQIVGRIVFTRCQ